MKSKHIIIATILFYLIVTIYFKTSTVIQYAIITSGKRYMYVSIIQSLLERQGVNNNDIHVFVTGDVLLPIKGRQTNVPINKEPYRFVLDYLTKKYEYIVLLEDDVFPAVDAVNYFKWGKGLLEYDDTIFAVSGSNDNSIDSLHGKLSNVFSRAEHFIGHGWLISSKNYMKYLHIHMDLCPSQINWKDCITKAINNNGLVTVFPMVQRTHRMNHDNYYTDLSFNTDNDVSFPSYYHLSKNYYKDYVQNYVLPHGEVRDDIRKYVPKFRDKMSNKIYGINNGIAIFPGKTKPYIIFNNNDESGNLRWKT